jgi:hypothetical protein
MKLQQIEKILELYQASKIPDHLYAANKPSFFFQDEKRGLMIATLFEIEGETILVHRAEVAREEHVDDKSLALYQVDARQILWNNYMDQVKNQLYTQYVESMNL